MSIDLSTYPGVDPTAATDSTAAINAALATGEDVYGPRGLFRLTDKLTMVRPNQRLWFEGKMNSRLLVDAASFNMSASAVIEAQGYQPGPDLREFGIIFTQPNTGDRGLLVPYAPAIRLHNAPRGHVEHVRIEGGWVGVDLTDGNSGGTTLAHIETSCFNQNFAVDGALDTIRLISPHIWPFGLSSVQTPAFFHPATTGIRSGRCDGLMVSDLMSICGTGLVTYMGSSGGTIASFSGGGFDSYNGFRNDGCQCVSFNGTYFTPGLSASAMAVNSIGAGQIRLSATPMFGAGSTPLVYNDHVDSLIGIDNATMNTADGDRSHVAVSKGEVRLFGTHHIRAPNMNHLNPTIVQYSGRVSVVNCTATDKGTGNGFFLFLTGGDGHQIHNNRAMGWGFWGTGYSAPSTNTRKSNNVGLYA